MKKPLSKAPSPADKDVHSLVD